MLQERQQRAARKAAKEAEQQRRAEEARERENDPEVQAAAYAARQQELAHMGAAEAEAEAEEFAPRVLSVTPPHGPREGGTVLLLRGTGFGSRRDEIAAMVGGVPCEETRWLSAEAVACVSPAGEGTGLLVELTRCECAGDSQAAMDTRNAGEAAEMAVRFSYDEDALKGIMSRIDIDIRPPGLPIQMHRQQMVENAAGALFEAKFLDFRDDTENFYAMLPAMAQFLPAQDKNPAHETCAVVGRSGSLLGSRSGAEIDKHSAIFRFDNSPTAFKYAADVGKRTKYQVLNAHWGSTLMGWVSTGDEMPMPRVTRWWIDVAAVVLWDDASHKDYSVLRNIYPNAVVTFLSRELVTLGAKFMELMRRQIERVFHIPLEVDTRISSQLYTVLLAMNTCQQVTIYGSDLGCSIRGKRCAYTYFDESEPSEKARTQLFLESNIIMALQEAGLVQVVATLRAPAEHPIALPGRSPSAVPRCDGRMCLPPCSGRGAFSNGTCHCHRMFGGASCELDLLELNAEQLVKDLPLTYHGDIVMHRQAVTWLPHAADGILAEMGDAADLGVIPLPEGVTRNRTEVGDAFLVDRKTYHMLPAGDDFLFENWTATRPHRDPAHAKRPGLHKPGLGTCALVGNSGTLLSHQYGADIDDHDVVYRFNQAPVAGFKREVGARTTHESLNSAWLKLLVEGKHGEGVFGQHHNWDWRSDGTALMLFELFDPAIYASKNKDGILTKELWWKSAFQKLRVQHPDRKVVVMSPKFVAWAYQLYQAFEDRFESLTIGTFRGEKPMSGYYAIMFALQVCSEVDVYGFTPYQESDAGDVLAPRYHYFDQAVPRHNSHSFDLTQNIYRLLARELPFFRIHD